MARPTALVLLLLLASAAPALPGAVRAQTPGPTPGQIVSQQQANLNQFQAQLQANQLQQLQRQNTVALQQPDPTQQAQAAARQQQIQQQIDQNTALRQQMLAPQSNPSDVNSRLQQYDAQIQQLQQQVPPPGPAQAR
jgi:hypothetical protein